MTDDNFQALIRLYPRKIPLCNLSTTVHVKYKVFTTSDRDRSLIGGVNASGWM